MLGCAATQAHVTRGQHEACGKALEVPFEWAHRHFVEIIQVENQLALGRREATEVHQMPVSADRHGQAAVVNLA